MKTTYMVALSALYLAPLFILRKNILRLLSRFIKKEEDPTKQQQEKKRMYRTIISILISIFIFFVLLRVYGIHLIDAGDGETVAKWNSYLIWLLIITIPLSLAGIGYGLYGLYSNKRGGSPLFFIFCSFAVLFIVSILAVLVQLKE